MSIASTEQVYPQLIRGSQGAFSQQNPFICETWNDAIAPLIQKISDCVDGMLHGMKGVLNVYSHAVVQGIGWTIGIIFTLCTLAVVSSIFSKVMGTG